MAIQSNFPALRPSLDLNFASSRTVDPRIAFSRAGTGNVASYFDEKGVMQFAPPNTPRIDFDPVTGKSLGLLIEYQRTNLLSYSSDLANATWTKIRSNITINAVVAIDGALTGNKLVEDTTSSASHYVRGGASLSASEVYTVSFYVKAGERSAVYITFGVSTGWNTTGGVTFDLAVGTSTTIGSGATGYITPVWNGWYRCTASQKKNATSGFATFDIGLIASGNSNYTGDGTSGLYIWGVQLEQGAFPTSYIPTTSAQVTRATDSLSSASLGASGAGTVVINAQAQSGQTFLSSGNMAVLAPNSAEHRIAVGYDSTSTRSSTDGAAVVSSAGSTGGADFSLMPGATGYVTRLSLYPRKLSDVNLQALTA